MATSRKEIAMDGPAAGRPCMRTCAVPPPRKKFTMMSSTCACRIEGAWKYSPAAAVPVSTKMPEPIIAPMPSAVSDHGPKVFCRRCPGASDSEISLSIDLQQKTWCSEVRITSEEGFAGSVVDDGDIGSTQHSTINIRPCKVRRSTIHRPLHHSALMHRFPNARGESLIPKGGMLTAKCRVLLPTASPDHAPSSSLSASSSHVDSRVPSADFPPCVSCGRRGALSCVRLCSVLLYWP